MKNVKSIKILFSMLGILMMSLIFGGNEVQAATDWLWLNPEYYANANEDIKAVCGYDYPMLENHFLHYGIREGREASLVFSPRYYLDNNLDVQNVVGKGNYEGAFWHFVNYGMAEGRRSSQYFDVEYYLQNNIDLQNAYGSNYKGVYEHFLNYGMKEGRRASADFDVDFYLLVYQDLRNVYGPSNYLGGYVHFVTYGYKEGRRGTALTVKELSKYISKVPITTENWLQYIELQDYEYEVENAFGEITDIYKETCLKLKGNNMYARGELEFEITNSNMIWDGDENINILEIDGDYLNSFWIQDQDVDPIIYDYRVTMEDINCLRTIGYIYIFDLLENIWHTNFWGDTYFYVESPDGLYGKYDRYDKENYVSGLVYEIEEGRYGEVVIE